MSDSFKAYLWGFFLGSILSGSIVFILCNMNFNLPTKPVYTQKKLVIWNHSQGEIEIDTKETESEVSISVFQENKAEAEP